MVGWGCRALQSAPDTSTSPPQSDWRGDGACVLGIWERNEVLIISLTVAAGAVDEATEDVVGTGGARARTGKI